MMCGIVVLLLHRREPLARRSGLAAFSLTLMSVPLPSLADLPTQVTNLPRDP